MRFLQAALCVAVLTWGDSAFAGEPTVRLASARTRQPNAEAPLLLDDEETELLPQSIGKDDGDEAERVPAEPVGPGASAGTTNNPFDYGTMQGSGLPASPYIAGLSYMMTPQPFRVPIPDRFYYPCPHFVRRCPYYPKGVYWGANWNRRFLPPNNLFHGDFRFNPYLSRRKAQKHAAHGSKHGNHCVPVVSRSASPAVSRDR